LPSNTSKANASGAIAAAAKKCATEWLPIWSIANNTAAVPHAALPSVRKSAR
jgi:hypothetical protein